MILCKQCGNRNEEGDEFCGSCGSFLEWTGEKLEEPQAPAPSAVAAPAAGPASEAPAPGAPGSAQAEEQAKAAAEAEQRQREAQAAAEEARHRAEEARRAQEEAQRKATEEEEARTAAAEAASVAAEQGRLREEQEARAEAARRAQEEAAEATRRAQDETASKAVEDKGTANARPEEEAAATARAQEEAAAKARAQEEAAAKARAEEEAAAKARAEEEAKRAREQAAAKARADEEARRAGEEAARAAEQARRAEEAARRAAALVAKPPPAPPRPVARPPSPPVSAPGPATAAPAPVAQQPGAVSPTAVKPAIPRPRPAPAASAVPARTIEPGDLVCGHCGEGNNPSRKFCRRCGSSLAVAAAAPVLPWWRRFFRRGEKVVAAGERPMRGRGGTRAIAGGRLVVARISKLVVALVVAALTLGAIGPWRHTITQHVNDLFNHTRREVAPQFNQVTPSGAVATSAVPGHDGSKAVDGLSNTSWAANPAAPNDGVGQVLVVNFAHPVNLARVLFTSGDPASLAAQPHPEAVALTLVPAQQGTVLNLKNQAAPQPFTVDGKGVTQVQIRINSVYPSSTGGHSVSIAEVEFFTKS